MDCLEIFSRWRYLYPVSRKSFFSWQTDPNTWLFDLKVRVEGPDLLYRYGQNRYNLKANENSYPTSGSNSSESSPGSRTSNTKFFNVTRIGVSMYFSFLNESKICSKSSKFYSCWTLFLSYYCVSTYVYFICTRLPRLPPRQHIARTHKSAKKIIFSTHFPTEIKFLFYFEQFSSHFNFSNRSDSRAVSHKTKEWEVLARTRASFAPKWNWRNFVKCSKLNLGVILRDVGPVEIYLHLPIITQVEI